MHEGTERPNENIATHLGKKWREGLKACVCIFLDHSIFLSDYVIDFPIKI